MPKPLVVEIGIKFVPLSPENRAAWEFAMRILSGYLEKARLELEANGTEISIARGCHGQLTNQTSGTPLEGENDVENYAGECIGGVGRSGAEGDGAILRGPQGRGESVGHVEQRPARKWHRRTRQNVLDRGPSRTGAADRDGYTGATHGESVP